jgi:hypothetical protein
MRYRFLTAFLAVSLIGVVVALAATDTFRPSWAGRGAEARSAVLSGGTFSPIADPPQSPALSPTPSLINFQGLLTDPGSNPAGLPKPDGSYSITFRVLDAATGGTNLWEETQTVTVENGLFTVLLGETTAFPANLFNGADRHLELDAVSGPCAPGCPPADPPMTPRLRFVSVPYAFHTNTADSANSADVASDVVCTAPAGCISGNEIIDGQVGTADIADETVTSTDITNSTIVSMDIADGTITGADVADNSIASADVTDNSLGSADVADNSLTADDVAINYAASTSEGGPASDLACTDCVAGSEAQFNYAGSTSEGGIANNSELLDGFNNTQFLRSDTSGTLNGNLTLNGQLATSNAQIVVNYDGGDGFQSICFFESASGGSCTEHMAWHFNDTSASPARSRFTFSDDVHAASDISTNGRLIAGTLAGSGGAVSICRRTDVGDFFGLHVLAACPPSSARYKEDIQPLQFDRDKLLALQPVDFKWKDRDERSVGLVAEDVEAVLPELVTYENGKVEGVNYELLSVYLLEILKEHEQELAGLNPSSVTGDNTGDGSNYLPFLITMPLLALAASGLASLVTAGVIVRKRS